MTFPYHKIGTHFYKIYNGKVIEISEKEYFKQLEKFCKKC